LLVEDAAGGCPRRAPMLGHRRRGGQAPGSVSSALRRVRTCTRGTRRNPPR